MLCVVKSFPQSIGNSFKITGHIEKLDNGTIIISYNSISNQTMVDSAKIVNGDFEFSGKIAQPDAVELKLINSKSVYFFLEPAQIKLTLTSEPFSIIKVLGSKTEDEFMEWKAAVKDVKQKISRVLSHQPEKNEFVKTKQFEDSLVFYNDQKHAIEYHFFRTHQQSYFSPYLLETQYSFYTRAQLKEIYADMGPAIQSSKHGIDLLNNIAKMEGNTKDAQALNIISKDYINNKEFDLSSLNGKYVMIDFWGSWCQPCIKLLPDLVEEHKKLGNKNVEFVSVAMDDSVNQTKCKHIVNKLGMTWTNLWSYMDKKDPGSITSVYNIDVFPTFILIDPNGKIIAREDSASGYYKCRDLLESVLKTLKTD